jgi:hypothetical protein
LRSQSATSRSRSQVVILEIIKELVTVWHQFKKGGNKMQQSVPQEVIEKRIFMIRGHNVMIDKDLAVLYDIATRDLNKAVTRNLERFPADFMFQLTTKEFENLKFHFGTSSWGGTRKMPRVFTEQGVAMLSSVLNSRRAIQVNIAIMRTFVRLKTIISTHKELTHKLAELERKIDKHDKDIGLIFEAIRQLMEPPPEKPKRLIGFKQD